jgi:hypothetical protein
VRRIGITAGASVPESLVQELCARLQQLGKAVVTEMAGTTENVSFRLPPMPAPRGAAVAMAAATPASAPERQVSPAGPLFSASRHR